MSSFLKSNRTFLHHFIKPYLLSVVGASLCSLVLSICATLISILVGPSLRLLMDFDFTKTVPLYELFGPRLGSWASLFFENKEWSVNYLIATLPLFLIGIAFLKLILGTSQYFLWERTSERMTRD